MTDAYDAETIVPADFDTILADPALAELKDGPAKDFLLRLSALLDYDDGQAPPQLFVRRAVVASEPRPGMDYPAAYVALREAVVALVAGPPVEHYRGELDDALNAADAAGAGA